MPFAKINGSSLYFEDSGGPGPVIVFCHGFMLDHTLWDHQVASLSSDYRCIAWDSRGHGMSEIDGAHTEWDLADDLAALLDHLGVRRASVVGLSQGGFVAFRFGLRHPDRATSLVFMDTSPVRMSDDELGGFEQMASAWCSTGPVGELIDGFAAFQFGAGWAGSPAWIGKWQARPPARWTDQWASILQQDTVIDRLGEIACPTLVLHGTADAAFAFPAVPERIAAGLPDCRGVVGIDGGPHACATTHPEPVTAALRTFFAEVLS
jgi:3-oxoadipate enol-lactonase